MGKSFDKRWEKEKEKRGQKLRDHSNGIATESYGNFQILTDTGNKSQVISDKKKKNGN